MGIELDATAGDRVIHTGRDISQIIFLDILPSVKPDIIGDAKYLPFRNSVFEKIYCDPPHLIRNDRKYWRKTYLRFGNWKNRVEWFRFLNRTNKEFARVLKPLGLLWYKIIDGKDYRVTKRKNLDFYENFELIEEKRQPTSAGWSTNICWHLTFKLRSSDTKANENEKTMADR